MFNSAICCIHNNIYYNAICAAAVLSPVGKIVNNDEVIDFGNTEMGEITKKLYDTLTGIQMGRIDAPEDWIKVIE